MMTKTVAFLGKNFYTVVMRTKIKELIRFFLLFYCIGVMLFVTFNLSFYINDFLFLLTNWHKLLFILVYSALLSIYFTFYIVYQIKHGRVGAFVSGLLAIHYLQEYKRSIGWSSVFHHFEDQRFIIETMVAAGALCAIIVTDIIMIYHIRSRIALGKEQDYFFSKNAV